MDFPQQTTPTSDSSLEDENRQYIRDAFKQTINNIEKLRKEHPDIFKVVDKDQLDTINEWIALKEKDGAKEKIRCAFVKYFETQGWTMRGDHKDSVERMDSYYELLDGGYEGLKNAINMYLVELESPSHTPPVANPLGVPNPTVKSGWYGRIRNEDREAAAKAEAKADAQAKEAAQAGAASAPSGSSTNTYPWKFDFVNVSGLNTNTAPDDAAAGRSTSSRASSMSGGSDMMFRLEK